MLQLMSINYGELFRIIKFLTQHYVLDSVNKSLFNSNDSTIDKIKYSKVYSFIILVSTFFVINLMNLKSETPVLDLPAFPVGYSLELYEDNDDLYSMKLIEYYKITVAYHTQLMLLGDTNKVNIQAPSQEELTENDSKTLRKFYNQAKKLHNIIKSLPISAKNRQIDSLKLSIKDMQVQNDSLRIYADSYSLLKARLDDNIKMVENTAKKLEDLSLTYEMSKLNNIKQIVQREKINLENQKIYSKFRNSVMLLDMSGNIISNYSSTVENHLSGRIGLSFNTGYLFNMGDFIHLDLGLLNYRNTTRDTLIRNNPISIDFENNIYNAGLSFNYKNITNINGLDLGLRGGYSYFWNSVNARNTNIRKNEINGNLLSLDLNLSNETNLIPYELYFGIKWYFLQDDLLIQREVNNLRTNIYNFGQESLVVYNLGIRIPIWRQIDYTKID